MVGFLFNYDYMKFLFKFPSRGRPNTFKETLKKHIDFLSNKNEYEFIFTFDNDDDKMNNDEIKEFIKRQNINYKIHYGNSKNKIEAINANIGDEDFDVLVLIADDMIPTIENYDEIIVDILTKSKHHLDSTIHFNTTRWSNILDIWCIMGKTYYDRFKYIYNPIYKSIYADNEYTEVAKLLDRCIFSEIFLFFHNYSEFIGDETERKNWVFNSEDEKTYNRRLLNNFN